MVFNKDIQALEKVAVRWWPDSLKKDAARISPIPLLLDSQEDFIAILRLCKNDPEQIFQLIEAAKFPANLFIKHLAVLADYGGESTQRLNKSFESVFTVEEDSKTIYIDAFFNTKEFRYHFKALPVSGSLTNAKIGIDGKNISENIPLDPLKKDLIMLLLFGASAKNGTGADLEKCEISSVLGKDAELDKYVRQKYIWVSRITGGATANTQGQLAQHIVRDHLKANLPHEFKIRSGAIKLPGYSKTSGMPFDIIVERNKKFIGIEVSFQVTTNSTIERKGGQAKNRQKLMHDAGHKIAYVIDGAGNFERRQAVSTICSFSDCTVAYTEKEFEVLLNFIKASL